MQEVSELLVSAQAETGLDDFGDESFREGLERLVWSLQSEATLNENGQTAIPRLIVNLLSQRLQVEDWYQRHPEIDDESIVAPLIGIGLPRTGSSALAFLLAEDPNVRSLRRWEAATPCPPPATVEGPDPRIAQAEAEANVQAAMAPRLVSLLPSDPAGPGECQSLMSLDFKAHQFQAFAHIPSYSCWVRDTDVTSTYRYVRRVLKMLQWGQPTRPWRLKSPSHMLWLDALDRVFPDVRYVMTHRDPVEVIVSVADLYLELCQKFSDDLDPHYLGRLNIDHWTTALQRLVTFRDADRDARFYDIDFRAMQRDPIGAVRGLYAWLGHRVTEEFETGMARWWEQHAATREPNIHPDPAMFGIDVMTVQALFADYKSRMAEWTQVTS